MRMRNVRSMWKGFLSSGLVAAALAFGCPCATLSQTTGSYQSGENAGPYTSGATFATGNPAPGPALLGSTINASALTTASSTFGLSVPNAASNSGVSGTPTTGSPKGGSRSLSTTPLRGAGEVKTASWGAVNGWKTSFSQPGMAASFEAIASMPSMSQKSSRSAYKVLRSFPGAATSRTPGYASMAAQHPAIVASTAGHLLPNRSGSTNSSQRKDENEGAEQQTSGSTSGGTYTQDFPDSTKNNAVISPPDPADHPVFRFKPGVGGEFPDFTEREFLHPNLHVGVKSGPPQTEDLYERIERRLSEYRQAATLSKGLEHEKLGGSAPKDPLARKKLSTGLTSERLSGLAP